MTLTFGSKALSWSETFLEIYTAWAIIFWWRMDGHIGTVIAYCVDDKNIVSDRQSNHGVKGQGQICW